jgi:hypothetical protein
MTEASTETTTPRRRRTSKRNVAPKENPAVDAAMQGLDLDAVDESASEDMKALDDDAMGTASIPEIDPVTEPSAPDPEPKPSKPMQQILQPAEVPPPKLSKDEERAIKEAERQARLNQSPSTKKLGAIGALLPGAERVRISKRRDSGQKAYIGEYGLKDLQGAGSIEAFINRYIKPTYGPGEYPIEGVTAHGGIIQCQPVFIMEPVTDPVPQPGGTDSALADLLRQQLASMSEQHAREIASLRDSVNHTPPPQDPIDTMQKLYSFQQEINPPKPEDNSLGAAMQAMAQMNQANMQMMMGLFGTVMQTLGQKPAMDPVLGTILAKLLEDKKGGDSMPMMPPPPPPNPAQNLRELAEVAAILKGDSSNDNKLLEYLLAKADQDRMSPKDVLQLVSEVKGERGTDDLKKSLENLGIMMNAVQTLRQNTEGGGGGWADAMAALFQNPSLGRIASSMVGGRGGAAAAALPEDTSMQERARIIQEKRLRLEERRLALAEAQIEEAERPGRTPHQPHVPPAPQQHRQVTEGIPVTIERQATAAQTVRQTPQHTVGNLPQFPDGIVDHVNELLGAQDGPERIQSFLSILVFLNQHEEWKALAQTILHHIHDGDPNQALPFTRTFLESLRDIQLIDDETVTATVNAMAEHFEEVVAHVRQLVADSNEPEPGEEDDDAGFTELAEEANILGLDEEEEEGEEDDIE